MVLKKAQRDQMEVNRQATLRRMEARERAAHDARISGLRDVRYTPIYPILFPASRHSGTPVVWGMAYGVDGAVAVVQFYGDKGVPAPVRQALTTWPMAAHYPGDMKALAEQYLGGRVPPTWVAVKDAPSSEQEAALLSYDPRGPLTADVREALTDMLIRELSSLEVVPFGTIARTPGLTSSQALTLTVDTSDDQWAEYAPMELDTWFADPSRAGPARLTFPEGSVIPNVTHAGLISFMEESTYTPSDTHYMTYLASLGGNIKEAIVETVGNQMKAHERMLRAGSTPACSPNVGITVGSLVRYRLNYVRDPPDSQEGRMRADIHNKSMEPDGSATWSSRIFNVKSITEATETTNATYQLAGKPRAFYRHELCSVNNIEVGVYVRIRLSANPYYRKQIDQRIRTGLRHTRYNHMFSRTIFQVVASADASLTVDDRRFFLDVAWAAKDVYPLAAWETDPAENLWSEEHYNLKQGLNPFHGYRISDLLRVDQQTALKMETPEGRAKYTECLAKINARFPTGVAHTVVEGPPRFSSEAGETLVALKAKVATYLINEGVIDEDAHEGALLIGDSIQGGDLWHDLRALLATASNLDRWATAGGVKTLLASKAKKARFDLSTVAAVRWGKESEPKARAQYELYLKVQYPGDLSVAEIGMVIDKTFTFGASPDGWVYDVQTPAIDGRRTLVGAIEIKCPSGSYFTHHKFDPATTKDVRVDGYDPKLAFYFDSALLERTKKAYFYQCLANLFLVEELQWLDFVVWLPVTSVAPNNPGPPFENMFVHRFTKSEELRRKWEALVATVRGHYDENLPSFVALFSEFVAAHPSTD
jgi:hypothetical protein